MDSRNLLFEKPLMINFLKKIAFALAGMFLLSNVATGQNALRPPAVPLVTSDPYFSIWSPSNELHQSETIHWTGREHRLASSIVVDGISFRLMGKEPSKQEAMKQVRLSVFPTRTVYEFESQKVALTLTFMTPSLPDSIDLLSWPLTYVSYYVRSLDGLPHDVVITFEASPEIAVNEPSQKTLWSSPKIDGLSVQAVGSETQEVLHRSGDDLRIDWGHLLIASPLEQKPTWEKHQLQLHMATVDAKGGRCWLMLAYDDEYSIQYMKENLRPYWRRNGWEASDLLRAANNRYEELAKKCEAFDDELMSDLRKARGEEYAQLGALCYRQCFAAGKFVADANGQPLQFSKENHSNGCIATSDVFYPMSPQFLLFGPSLAKSFVVPFMNYAASDRWKFPFAPHDLGQYPLANGQVYGGGERTEENQMPVEESGNLLLLFGAIAKMEGNPGFANLYWKQIETWAEYLKGKGFDPENQLCTDDFAGHLAHNVNLSAKAICALGAYGQLCEMRGETEKAKATIQLAKEFAKRWMEAADEGDHYRLAFDAKGTWSQKYNLVWDKILGLNLFPESVAKKEMAYYRKIQDKYGLGLDNRATYTKLDWIMWSATLTQDREDFDTLLRPVIRFIQETPDRSPLTDWYQANDAKKVGFTARPVVGGVFLQLLYDQATWSKWAKRDSTKAADWAPMPKLPIVTEIVKTAVSEPSEWRYTTTKPDSTWYMPSFDLTEWKLGRSGFGTQGTPNTIIGTTWSSNDIWLAKEIELTAEDLSSELHWNLHHDEDTEIYINGSLALRLKGYSVQYELRPIAKSALTHFKKGKNRIAVHCLQTGGGQYIDVGIAKVTKQK